MAFSVVKSGDINQAVSLQPVMQPNRGILGLFPTNVFYVAATFELVKLQPFPELKVKVRC